MLLAIDVGNSQTSFGVFRDEGRDPAPLEHWRAQTKVAGTEDEIAAFFFPLVEAAIRSGVPLERPTSVAVASVVPGAEDAIARFARRYLQTDPYFVAAGTSGIHFAVDNPNEVGADRVANAAYAIARLPLPAIVIDIGTATTFDVVDRDSSYLGGAILPGPRMAAAALGSKTARLPTVALRMPERVIGRNTVDCLRSGLVLGYLDGLQGLLARTERELGGAASVVLTGGDAGLYAEGFERTISLVPDLTLEGIRILFERR